MKNETQLNALTLVNALMACTMGDVATAENLAPGFAEMFFGLDLDGRNAMMDQLLADLA